MAVARSMDWMDDRRFTSPPCGEVGRARGTAGWGFVSFGIAEFLSVV
jgi:hypothetical protein